MIKKAFLNSVYLQRIHDEYILDMYAKKATAEYICKTDKAIHSNFQKKKMVNHI